MQPSYRNIKLTLLSIFACTLIPPAYAQDHALMPMHDMSYKAPNHTTHQSHSTANMSMHGMYGLYPMSRDASGTSWQPDSTPFTGMMLMTDKSMYMLQGFANFIYDNQGDKRGTDLGFSTSMLMFMAQRDLDIGTIGFRSMFSLDPVMGKGGYPLLLQTGETANGRTPLIDKQHPHDAIMELAGTYSLPITNNQSAFIYAGLPGEPALGPPNFMMRWSGMYIPEAPITHHWLDSTHTTYGVVTLGYILNTVKLEISSFNGREPDQNRWGIESPKLNSQSIRLSYNPNVNWSLQTSFGHLKSPEQLEPNVNTNRTTASIMYNRSFTNDSNWQTTFAWGMNANNPGHILNGYLFESTVQLHETHTFFGRAERVQKDELFAAPSPYVGKAFTVNKLSVGYLYEFPNWYHAKPGLGALISMYSLPNIVQTAYGNHPFSYMLFGRIAIA